MESQEKLDRVVIEDAPRMNLLGLMLASIIRRNLDKPGAAQRLGSLSGDVVVQAGEMKVTLAFAEGTIHVSRGAAPRPRAAIQGSMDSLLGLALGGGMVVPWLTGRLKTRGSLLLLLRLKPLLNTD